MQPIVAIGRKDCCSERERESIALSISPGNMSCMLSFSIFFNLVVLCSSFHPTSPFHKHSKTITRLEATVATTSNIMTTDNDGDDSMVPPRQLLIHWRGEKDSGYSKPFRQLEFIAALEAELGTPHGSPLPITFSNALDYTGQAAMADVNIEHFNEAMQYLEFSTENLDTPISRSGVIRAVERCSLVHAVYEVVASADDLTALASLAIDDGGFADMYKGGDNEKRTWCFRARNYRDPNTSDAGREKRYGSRARSMALEKAGLTALKDLLILFGGKVDLLEPDCKIYIFDGLVENSKTLARRIASGPRTSSIAPATRICITTTPLCPIASFALCNVARITTSSRILDPYAGSCAILLAAAMIAPESETIGIEIANNYMVNRDDIRKDFSIRQLSQPKALLQGDCIHPDMRRQARDFVGSKAFDAIVTDPPYGIRESTGFNEKSPMEELFTCIANDRDSGHRLLKTGGRLVAFVPVTDEETLPSMLPDSELTDRAGLIFEVCREQPLNEKLSRWLVSFVCTR